MPKPSPARRALWNKSSLCGLAAILLESVWFDTVAGVGASPPPPPLFWIKAYTLGPAALVWWVFCVSFYAQSKGLSKNWGFAGLITCGGFFLVMLIPSRWRDDPVETGFEGDYPRPKR